MEYAEGLVQRKHLISELNELENKESFTLDEMEDVKEIKLTLTEKIFLLGLKDVEGYISFWNDCISTGLRGCILIDLCLRGKIQLEQVNGRCKSLLSRKVIVTSDTATGDALLDEAFRHINVSCEAYTVPQWIEYLGGETWNPIKLRYRLKNLKNRIAKALVEKGVLTTSLQDFFVFNITTHPLIKNITKSKLIKIVQSAILTNWSNDCLRMDKRVLAVIFMAHASDVLEEVFTNLNREDYQLVKLRMANLLDLDFEVQAYKSERDAVIWAVFTALQKLVCL